MNRSELIFSVLRVPLDYLMVIAAGLTAYAYRFGAFTDIRPALYAMPLSDFLNLLAIVAIVWILAFAVTGLYKSRSTQRLVFEIGKVIVACSASVMVLILLIFFQRELFSSRFIIVLGWALSIVYVSIMRAIVRSIQMSFVRRGVGAHRTVLVGSGPSLEAAQTYIREHPESGYRVIATLPVFDDAHRSAFADISGGQEIDEVILVDPSTPHDQTLALLNACAERNLYFSYAASLFDTRMAHIELTTLAGIPLIGIQRTRLAGWGKVLKRVFDLLGGTFLILVLSPLLLLVAIGITVDSRGPIFVHLERIGRGGRHFRLHKFRSMVPNAHALKPQLVAYNERNDGPLFKMKNDPRITRIGRFLRRTSLDELPQLWNVIRGTMSLVGPRPHEPEEVAQYTKDQRTLLVIRPGITGLSQISGRSDLTFREEVRLDTYYVEDWSLWIDLQILAKTPWVLLRDRHAA